MAFEKRWAQKFARRPKHFKRVATINGRPAHIVIAERKAENKA